MTIGLKANNDGSGALQVNGTDRVTLSSAGVMSVPAGITADVTGNVTGNLTGAADKLGTASGSAPSYAARAWVNFNGAANTNLSGTYSQSGTTVTVTATAHGLIVGNIVYSDITSGTAVDGLYTVATVADANTFTYTAGTSLTTSGNITLTRSTIRASGNVSSVADTAVGVYEINFATAMSDVNYAPTLGWDYRGANQNSGGFTVANCLTTSCRVATASGGSAYDSPLVSVAIFR